MKKRVRAERTKVTTPKKPVAAKKPAVKNPAAPKAKRQATTRTGKASGASGATELRRSKKRMIAWWELVDYSRYPESASSGEKLFMAFLDLYAPSLPIPPREIHLWGDARRADFYWEDWRLAVEIEGGAFSGGRHTRGEGFTRDCWKYNELARMQIWLLRFTPQMLKDDPEGCLQMLMQTVEGIKRGSWY
jgi:hypothetical protein